MIKKQYPLMPKATAVWLVDNTTLTFKQISDFCGMHVLEIQGIANGEVATGIIGIDPVINNQLTKEEIERCSNDPEATLKIKDNISSALPNKFTKKRNAKYTPIARRHDKPDAILWLIKNIPGITDVMIVKLIGTTKNTIEAIRFGTHWNIQNIRQRDPVLLGLCSQTEVNNLIDKLEKKTTLEDSAILDSEEEKKLTRKKKIAVKKH